MWSWGDCYFSSLGYLLDEGGDDDDNSAEDFDEDDVAWRFQNTPRQVHVAEEINIKCISTAKVTTLIVDVHGDVWSMGINILKKNQNPDDWTTVKPLKYPHFANIIEVYSGQDFAFFVDDERNVYGLGNNESGQLGLGHMNSPIIEPTIIPKFKGMIYFYCYVNSVFSIDSDNQGYFCCVYFANAIKNVDKLSCLSPQKHPALTEIKKLVKGSGYLFALKTNNKLYYGCFSQIVFPGETSLNPIEFELDILDITGAGNYIAILDANNDVWVVKGNNRIFELVKIENVPCIVEIASVSNTIFMRDSLGCVWSAGSNSVGQLGIGTFDDQDNRYFTAPIEAEKIPCDFDLPKTPLPKSARF